MITVRPTPKGTGVTILGDEIGLNNLLQTILQIVLPVKDDTSHPHHVLLLDFAGKIQKVLESNSESDNPNGFNYLWTDMIVILNILRHQSGFTKLSSHHQVTLNTLETSIFKALHEYDPLGARRLTPMINRDFDIYNPLLLQILDHVNSLYLNEMVGKSRFRKLAGYFTEYFYFKSDKYKELIKILQGMARQQSREMNELKSKTRIWIGIKW